MESNDQTELQVWTDEAREMPGADCAYPCYRYNFDQLCTAGPDGDACFYPDTVSIAVPGASSREQLYRGRADQHLYDIAASNPYVKERILQTAWRSQHEAGGKLTVNTNYSMGSVVYMRFHEIAPGIDRIRMLPAAVIVPGNPEMAGINVIAFVNTSQNRVEYIGFVPRSGTSVDNTTFTSTAYGLDERDPVRGLHQYNNVTIVDTGFIPGMSLSAGPDRPGERAGYDECDRTRLRRQP